MLPFPLHNCAARLVRIGRNILPQRDWFVVYSKPKREPQAQMHLCAKGLDVFFPRLLLPQAAKNRNRVFPLFPNYLFVRLDLSEPTEYFSVIWCPGVSRLVSFNGSPASIDEHVIEFLMRQTNNDGIIMARANLRKGQEIRISGGPLAGLAGILQDFSDAKGRVKILLNLLNRQTNVELPVHFVETRWVAAAATVAA
jgi:transcription elongation factor/antiterminator RfaH